MLRPSNGRTLPAKVAAASFVAAVIEAEEAVLPTLAGIQILAPARILTLTMAMMRATTQPLIQMLVQNADGVKQGRVMTQRVPK
jgi:hypothetical protein